MTNPKTEQVVSLPILNPETGTKARGLKYAGKIDRIEGEKVIDWKGVASPHRFVQQLRIGYQVELYALGIIKQGYEISEVEYRLVTRPTIRLCGKDKDAQAYEDRCVEWLLDSPDKMVKHPYPISKAKLNQAQWYLWESSRRLLENMRCNRWMPNVHACWTWERECPYADLCDAVQNGDDVEWLIDNYYRHSLAVHPELGPTFTNSIVTHSSLTTLHLCEMKYFWQYVRGLKKGLGEDSEALWIGSAMHAGQEKIDEGEGPALEAINAWGMANPTVGPDASKKHEQNIARARAMVRASAQKWPV